MAVSTWVESVLGCFHVPSPVGSPGSHPGEDPTGGRGYNYECVAKVDNVREPALHALAYADAVAVSQGATGVAMQLLFPRGAAQGG